MNNTDNNSLPTAICRFCGDDTFSPQHTICQLCALDVDISGDPDDTDPVENYGPEPREDFGYFGEMGMMED